MLNNIRSAFKRIFLRDKNELKKKAMSNRKVCMVVWNTFETDARVMKEAMSLRKFGKEVTVIAVHDHRRTVRFEKKDGIIIKRVDRTLCKKDKPQISVPVSAMKVNPVQEKSNKKNDVKTYIKRPIKKVIRWIPKVIISIRFFSYAFRENAGIYHTHDLNTLIPSFLVSRLRGAILIYDAHEVSTDRAGWKNKWFWKLIENQLIKKANVVITTNQTRADFFVREYSINMPYIIRNVPPYQSIKSSNKIREICNIPSSIPIILYQGGIQRERGLEKIIEAIPLVNQGVFVFIGNGALKLHLINLVKELEVENKVYFMDAVPNKELLYYTSSADIGLQLLQNTCFNHYSATSNKLHEYLMASVPVVCSDLPEMRKVVESVNFGVLVDPEDPKLIAKKINYLVNNKELRKMFKNNAMRERKNYCWENEESKLFEIYNLFH